MENLIFCYKNLNTLYVNIRANLSFIESITNFSNYIDKVEISDEFIRNNEITLSFAINTTLVAYLNILQNSFLDEYNKFFNCNNIQDKKLCERIKKIKEYNKPLLNIIDSKWNNIKSFRNNCNAHNLRIRKYLNDKKYIEESIFKQENTTNYSIPYTFREHRLFLQIIQIIINNICFEFENEINDFENIINLKITDKINFIKQETKDEDFEEIKKYKHY